MVKSSSKIRFSVVIPYYNKLNYISGCLESLIDQELKDFEVIIIDDYSEHEILNIIDTYIDKFFSIGVTLKYIRLSDNKGPSYARNIGIKESKGTYIAFLDADDLWHSQKLNIVDLYLDKYKPLLLAHHSSLQIDDSNELYSLSDFTIEKYVRFKIFIKNIATTPSVIIKNGSNFLFDESMRYSEDYDLWLRIILFNDKIFFLNGPPLTFLGRPVLSVGGASSNKLNMRLGEIISFAKLLSTKYSIFVPILIFYSFLKYFYLLMKQIFRL